MNDCKIEPNIPIYLIVSGVIGTIQHVIVVWTKYVPKDAKGRLNKYRRCCERINGLFHLFNIVWFILGKQVLHLYASTRTFILIQFHTLELSNI